MKNVIETERRTPLPDQPNKVGAIGVVKKITATVMENRALVGEIVTSVLERMTYTEIYQKHHKRKEFVKCTTDYTGKNVIGIIAKKVIHPDLLEEINAEKRLEIGRAVIGEISHQKMTEARCAKTGDHVWTVEEHAELLSLYAEDPDESKLKHSNGRMNLRKLSRYMNKQFANVLRGDDYSRQMSILRRKIRESRGDFTKKQSTPLTDEQKVFLRGQAERSENKHRGGNYEGRTNWREIAELMKEKFGLERSPDSWCKAYRG